MLRGQRWKFYRKARSSARVVFDSEMFGWMPHVTQEPHASNVGSINRLEPAPEFSDVNDFDQLGEQAVGEEDNRQIEEVAQGQWLQSDR